MTTPARPTRSRPRLLAAVATVALGLGLVPLTATPAFACSCVGGTDAEHARRADAVFVGRVDETLTGSTSATFVVDEVFKGDVHTYTDLVTASGGPAACGLEFVRGQTMVVFARYGDANDTLADTEPGQLVADLCNGTRTLGVVGSAPIKIAAPGYAPVAGTSAPAEPGFPLLGWLSFVAVAGLGAVPMGLWARLRKR